MAVARLRIPMVQNTNIEAHHTTCSPNSFQRTNTRDHTDLVLQFVASRGLREVRTNLFEAGVGDLIVLLCTGLNRPNFAVRHLEVMV